MDDSIFNQLKLHHIGVACWSIEKTSKIYRILGYEITEIISEPNQKVKACFLSCANSTLIELLEPDSDDSPILGFLNKNSAGPYHLCFLADDFIRVLLELKRNSFVQLTRPLPSISFENRDVCFFYHKDFGFIEIIDNNGK